MTLRLDDTLDQSLTELSARVGVSKQKLVVTAIEDHLARASQSSFAHAVVDKVLARDRELLERLADS